jgi:hypothetical protein
MSSEQDASEFVDADYQFGQHPVTPAEAAWSPTPAEAAPTAEEVDAKVAETQQKLAELRRAQEELERERSTLEEVRRRQREFQTGRQEILQNLIRGVGLLEEAELNARRDAEQMGKTLADFKDALAGLEAIREETWTNETFSVELTRALTAIENARMEWNSARIKLPLLTGDPQAPAAAPASPAISSLTSLGFWKLCRLGLALTWPLLLVALVALGTFIAILATRR